tara:strand:- start:5408 stop:5905 length:498 start_codon:yes stop_codon:yes gene_type:complete
MKKIIFSFIVLFAVVSCKSKKTATIATTEPVEELELTETHPRDSSELLEINVSESNDMRNRGDSYNILAANIIKDELWIDVSYGGGCKEHQFDLMFNNAYIEKESKTGEIFPRIQLTLKHHANGDACRSIVREKIRFNLKGVQDKGLHEFQILLVGWEQILIYNY